MGWAPTVGHRGGSLHWDTVAGPTLDRPERLSRLGAGYEGVRTTPPHTTSTPTHPHTVGGYGGVWGVLFVHLHGMEQSRIALRRNLEVGLSGIPSCS